VTGRATKAFSENPPVKMYILVRDAIPLGFAMVGRRARLLKLYRQPPGPARPGIYRKSVEQDDYPVRIIAINRERAPCQSAQEGRGFGQNPSRNPLI